MKPLYIFLLFGLILSVLFSSGQIENPDTHLRLTQTRILVQDHTFGLPTDVGEDMHGNIAINIMGERHMVYNPGQSIVFIPIYYAVKFFSSDEVERYYFAAFVVSFINYIIHAICAFFLFKIALKIGATKKNAYLLSFLWGLTSYSFVFAQSTYEHHFEMLFILMSIFYALENKSIKAGFISGILISLGVIFRSTTMLAVPGILLLQKSNLSRLSMLLSLVPGFIFIFFYNYYRFGDPLESGYSLAWTLAHEDSFSFWSISRMPSAIFGFIFSPGKGLLFFSPTILFAILGVRNFWLKNQRLSYSILIICAAYLGIFSMNFAWHGSIWSFGPRYILPIIPLLYLPLIYLKPKKWMLFTAVIAFAFQIVLISVNYKRDVLEEFVTHNGLSDIQYIYSRKKIPYYSQTKQLLEISPKNFSTELKSYQPNSPWKKEIRTASSIEVLDSSIEKNSINFWWVRVFHWRLSLVSKIISVVMLILALMGSLLLFRHVKRKII